MDKGFVYAIFNCHFPSNAKYNITILDVIGWWYTAWWQILAQQSIV